MRWVAPMELIANDRGLVEEVLQDRRGGRGTMPLGWFRSLLETRPAVAPESYVGPPVLLLHPGRDRWTPLGISQRFLERVAGRTEIVVLEGCGHFPVEEPGFTRLMEVLGREFDRLVRTSSPSPRR